VIVTLVLVVVLGVLATAPAGPVPTSGTASEDHDEPDPRPPAQRSRGPPARSGALARPTTVPSVRPAAPEQSSVPPVPSAGPHPDRMLDPTITTDYTLINPNTRGGRHRSDQREFC
jgi:hypothetical protein